MKIEMHVLGLLKFKDGRIVLNSIELGNVNEEIKKGLQFRNLCKEDHEMAGGWHIYSLYPEKLSINSCNFKVNSAELGYYHHRVIMHFDIYLNDNLNALRMIEEKINRIDDSKKTKKGRIEFFFYAVVEIGGELLCYISQKMSELLHLMKILLGKILDFYILRGIRGELKRDILRNGKRSSQLAHLIHDYTAYKLNCTCHSQRFEEEKTRKFSFLRHARREIGELSHQMIREFIKDRINLLSQSGKIREEGEVEFVYTYPLMVVEKDVRSHESLPFSEETTSLCFEIFEPSLWPLLGKIHLMRISIPSTILYIQKNIGESLLRDIINAIYQHCLYEKRSQGGKTHVFENTLDEELLVNLWTHILATMGGRAIDVYSTKISHRRYFIALIGIGIPLVISVITYLL